MLIALAVQIPTSDSHEEEDAYVINYTAIFHSNLVLEETYTYQVNTLNKHFLYRYWEVKLSEEDLNSSYVQLLDIQVPSDSIGYMKDYLGSVYLFNETEPSTKVEIAKAAYDNEAGAYSIEGYQTGQYTVRYWFRIVPPLEYDEDYIHLNMMLADNHIYYDNVKIVIEDNGQIDSIYIHPPTLKKTRDRNTWVFSGKSSENELLEFEILYDSIYRSQLSGDYTYINGVKGLTTAANNILKAEYLIALLVLWGTKISVIVMPLILFLLWYWYGREKEYTVPEYLSTIPVKVRKPWIVNLVFKKSVTDFDEDALYATLIDLHLKNKIKISQSDSLSIQILSDTGLDTYESETVKFLQLASENNIVTRENIERLINEAESNPIIRGRVINLKYGYNRLAQGTNNQVSSEFTVNGRSRLIRPVSYSLLLIIIAFFGFLVSYDTEDIFLRAFGYSLIPLLQVTIALVFPTTLFGYWKKDYFKEKLQWEAFKRNLTDYSRISNYGPEDLNMWGSWLVYGTALGVGKQVSESLKKINVPINIPLELPEYRTLFKPIMIYSYTAPSSGSSTSRGFSSSSSHSGGGFGSRGGFGGGGGGVR